MRFLRFALLLSVCLVLSGCVKYQVTLTDGSRFTVLGKPKYDERNGVYRYKSGGKEVTVSEGRVSSIEPASMAEDWDGPNSSTDTNSDWYKQ